jgi:hypothetical protein
MEYQILAEMLFLEYGLRFESITKTKGTKFNLILCLLFYKKKNLILQFPYISYQSNNFGFSSVDVR